MEPFKITCVSCRAVLTVRKESMIGQIIACPRCSMMVQVLPPPGYGDTSADAPPPSPPGAKPVATPSDNSKSKVAASAAAAAALFESPDALADVTSPPAPPSPSSDPIFAAAFDDAVESLEAPPPPPPAAPTPAAVAPSHWAALKFPAMIAGGAVAGAAIVATALALFSGGDPAPQQFAANVPPAAAPPLEPTPRGDDAAPAAPAPPPATQTPADATASTAEPPPIEPSTEDLFADSPETIADNATASHDQAAETPIVEEATAPVPLVDADDAATANESASPDKPKLRIDPLEIDPEGLNLSALYHGPPKDPLAASHLPGEAVGVELSVPAADAAPPDAAAAEVGEVAAQNVRRDDRPVGPPIGDVPTLLARKIPELKVQNMPLCRLLDLSVQLTGLPVSVAPEQLRLAAVSAGQPATADVKEAAIEDFLAAALKPLRLQPRLVGDQIVLVRGSDDPRRSISYPVDDLARDPHAVEQLVTTIQSLVAPDSWQSAGGDGSIAVNGGKLVIEAAESTHYDILLLLERTRAAVGLASRSKYPKALIDADAAPVALAERMSAPATFTFSQYAPLREIFRYWQEEVPVAVLVDWPEFAELRLWPNTRIACSSADKPWDEALDEVLAPLGLAWRPIDKRTVQITTLEKAAAAPLVEIYRLDSSALAESAALQQELEKLAANSGAPADMTIIVDAERALLYARQPATVQRAIADYLAQRLLK